MIGKLALRNLLRNRWRTVLTMGGVAAGVALLIWMNAYMAGFQDEIIRGATAAESAQIQVASVEWVKKPSARYSFAIDDALLGAVEQIPGVTAVAPRVSVFGLVGNEERSVVAKLTGVDPLREANTTVIASGLTAGRWLAETPPEYPAPREVVLGHRFASQIEANVGDEVVGFFEAADGALGNELFTVVGIVRTGNSALDRQGALIHIADMQVAAAMEGQVHELAVRIDNPNLAPELADQIEARIARDDLEVRSWDEIMPSIKSMIEVMNNSDIVIYIFMYILVAFGLFNAQRMSALERRREFAVMMAIGVTPRRLFGTVMVETMLIALGGALLGAALGSAISYYFVVHGLNLAAFSASGDLNFEMMGISFSTRLPFVLTLDHVIRPIVALVPFAVLCGLWPAAYSARVEITNALSGRN